MQFEGRTRQGTKFTLKFRPIRFLIQTATFVFIALNAPWYVAVAALVLVFDIEGRK